MQPREVLERSRVTIKWLLWQVCQEEIAPDEAAWSMCPDVDPLSAGWLKLIGHAALVFTNWRSFFRENGFDEKQRDIAQEDLMKIWNIKKDSPICRLRQRK
jgi:hypothetical protein